MRAALQKINGDIFIDFSLTCEEIVAISDGYVISEEIEIEGQAQSILNIGIKSDVYFNGDTGKDKGLSEGCGA